MVESAIAMALILPCFARYYERRLKGTTQAYMQSLPCTVWVVFERPGNEPRIHASARIGTHCSLDYRPAFHRLSSSALLITLTLLSAIAAPANTGLSMPNAASGMPTTL